MDTFKTFISLLALVNPLGAIPFFITFTATNTQRERRRSRGLADAARPAAHHDAGVVQQRVDVDRHVDP